MEKANRNTATREAGLQEIDRYFGMRTQHRDCIVGRLPVLFGVDCAEDLRASSPTDDSDGIRRQEAYIGGAR